MRIGVVVQEFPKPSETFIVTKVLGMLDSGFDVTVFATRKSSSWSNFELLKGRNDLKKRIVYSVFQHRNNLFIFGVLVLLKVWFVCLKYPTATYRLIKNIRKNSVETGLKFLPQFLYQLMFIGKKVDVLHIEFDFQSYGLLEIKDVINCKIVVSGRGSVARTSVLSKFPHFYSYLFSYIDHYHFISEYLLAEAKVAGLPGNLSTSLIAPAIDLSLFKPSNRAFENDPIRIISMGRLSWAKGYEFMIDAVAIVYSQFPNISYHILGEGEYKEAITFAALQHGLLHKGVIHFEGLVSREKVVGYLQQSDIMLHLALEEGFCNAVIEGQAMELPVVCSDAGGLPENVSDGFTGFVVPRRNAEAAASALIKLISDKSLRKAMGHNGSVHVRKFFNLSDQKMKFKSMYEEIECKN